LNASSFVSCNAKYHAGPCIAILATAAAAGGIENVHTQVFMTLLVSSPRKFVTFLLGFSVLESSSYRLQEFRTVSLDLNIGA
jgi:hypothetical protein